MNQDKSKTNEDLELKKETVYIYKLEEEITWKTLSVLLHFIKS